MSDLAKREENGVKGESRTLAILVDDFWVLKRSVDVGGADFLVQIPAENLDELFDRNNKIQVFGIIQTKYFENNNQVKILSKYVECDKGLPRTEFFALLHSTDKDGEDIHFFFTANEVQKEFYKDKTSKHYCFSITQDRNYTDFKNIKKKTILSRIKEGILSTEKERNVDLIKIVYVNTQHTVSHSPATRIIETNEAIHKLEQKNSIVQITKTSKSTGTEQVVSTFLGNIDDIDYNPVSDTCTVKQRDRLS